MASAVPTDSVPKLITRPEQTRSERNTSARHTPARSGTNAQVSEHTTGILLGGTVLNRYGMIAR